MRKEWECPKDCPNRKVGCQNPKTCKTYALRKLRSEKVRGERILKAFDEIPRSTKTIKGERKSIRTRGYLNGR